MTTYITLTQLAAHLGITGTAAHNRHKAGGPLPRADATLTTRGRTYPLWDRRTATTRPLERNAPAPTLHLTTKRSIRGRTRKPLPTAGYLTTNNGIETPLTWRTENNQ